MQKHQEQSGCSDTYVTNRNNILLTVCTQRNTGPDTTNSYSYIEINPTTDSIGTCLRAAQQQEPSIETNSFDVLLTSHGDSDNRINVTDHTAEDTPMQQYFNLHLFEGKVPTLLIRMNN